MPEGFLPEGFRDLEPLAADWALATQRERERKRSGSTAEEMQRLHAGLLPRMEEVLEYLNRFSLDALPADAARLLHLTLSLAEIAPFVEFYGGRSDVPNAFDEHRFITVHGDRVG